MIRRRTLLAATGGALLTGAPAAGSAGAVTAGSAGAVTAGSAGAPAAGSAPADATVSVDPAVSYGDWEGWGTSLAWWANVFGDRDDFADLFFTTGSVPYGGTTLPGLGLNIARYNLGACGWNSVDGATMVASPDIPAFKQIEGYWQDGRDENPASAAWKWSADAAQRAMLVKAARRGATTELFANSPMWWMCANHNPSGAADGGTNLPPAHYRHHAAHLAAVALRARTDWGVRFASVEPFNEPSSPWWTATGTQEGCHLDPAVQEAVLPHLRRELDRRGLTDVHIAASDETSYDLARTTWNSFGATTRAYVDRVNVHGYQGAGGRRDLLYRDVVTTSGKALWNSETGDRDATGLTLATNLLLDFHRLHPTAWVYWQVMDPSAGWAMITYDPDTRQPGAVQPKYYVMAQFSRHIRPGMRILATDADHAVAALDGRANRLVLVAANPTTTARTLTFELSRFTTATGGPGGLVPRWVTATTGTDRYRPYTDTHLTGKTLKVPLAPGVVQTLQVDGVRV